MPLYVLSACILLSVTSMRGAKLHISSMLKRRGDCSVLYDNLVDWNNGSEIKVCTQQFRTKLLLFYTAHQLYCHSDTVTNRHECALESSSCKNCFQDFAQQWGLELQTAQVIFIFVPLPPSSVTQHVWFSPVRAYTLQMPDRRGRLPITLSIIYTLSFNTISYIRDYIGLLELCTLLPSLIFFYSNLMPNRQSTPSEAGSYLESS